MAQSSNNFAEYILELHCHQPYKTAVVDDNRSLTYSQLDFFSKNFAGTLQNSGVRGQDRVIICMEDSVEWVIAFLAVISVGGNPVLVSYSLPEPTIRHVVELSDARYIIGRKYQKLTSFSQSDVLNSCDEPICHFYQFHPDEICHWALTSGTTGDPKCIVHRHQDLECMAQLMGEPYHFGVDSRVLSSAKLSFLYGLTNSLILPLYHGSTAYLINGIPVPSVIYDRLKRFNITHFMSGPTVLNSMLKHGKNEILPASLDTIVSSGEPLPQSVASLFLERHGIALLDGLGMGECGYNYCVQTTENAEFGTIGSPVAGVECEVRDDSGGPTPDGEIGELWTRHPCMAIQYWKDWHKTKGTFFGEWIKTGDKVIKQPNGNFLYVSRADDLIKINGQYVSPIEIESILLENVYISDAVVVAKPNQMGMAEIHAFLTTTETVAPPDIRRNLLGKLAPHKVPKHIHIVGELPKTATNKKMRSPFRVEEKFNLVEETC